MARPTPGKEHKDRCVALLGQPARLALAHVPKADSERKSASLVKVKAENRLLRLQRQLAGCKLLIIDELSPAGGNCSDS